MDCIFRAFRGINFENFPSRRQPWWRLGEFHAYTGLLKKTLDTSLYTPFYMVISLTCF